MSPPVMVRTGPLVNRHDAAFRAAKSAQRELTEIENTIRKLRTRRYDGDLCEVAECRVQGLKVELDALRAILADARADMVALLESHGVADPEGDMLKILGLKRPRRG